MKRVSLLLISAVLLSVGCDTETPTTLVVDNDYPPVPDGGDPATEMTVFKVWWATTLAPDAVAPASEGQTLRSVSATDFAYAVLAPGWDPGSGTTPTVFVPMKSRQPLTVARGDTLHIHVSDATFAGNCAAGSGLTQDSANVITQRIFPGEFPGVIYDERHCVLASARGAAGADAGEPDGGSIDSADANESGADSH